jgi:hypothetical protein
MPTQHAKVSKWHHELLPHMVDRLARETPDALYGLWPVNATSYDEGFRAITYAELANVVNGLALHLTTALGPGGTDVGQAVPVISYVGPNDVRYMALAIAAIKAGYVVWGKHH